ncbi:MAG TPA: sugar phosphate isomerase/epimerase family protein, partial [Candidatus Dormibacteraeota bacterium]|nr:sugar phosphate isomerase/epimerase family protein [Candidatus Dormibacteraeota bacterium]
RRKFLAMSAGVPALISAAGLANIYGASGKIPVGLELFSVRESLKRDQDATLRAVAKMGYQCVEFYAPYFDWTEAQAKQTRKLLDDLEMKCYSTHNSAAYFTKENLPRAKNINLILGSKYLVMASSNPKTTLDQWTELADTLNHAADELEPDGLKTGYHNHKAEFTPLKGKRPMEILAANTKPTVMLQLDVGTCLEAGSDPVAWIRANPGRIRSIHCKDWGPGADKGYKVLFGEGVADWRAIFHAAENGGGVEYYLVEQEGSRFSELDTAQKCLDAFKNVQASS